MTSRKPLTGIRVLDFTRLFAGPFCTMLLGDLGADVAKIEAPDGDPIRHQGPPFHQGQSMSYLAVNRNKRSIVLDFKTAEARALAQQLAGAADVIVENFRPGVMDRLGLGYDALAATNPKIVYAAMSGMGADGPDRDLGAFDLTIQAEGGYMSITGERGGAPIKLGPGTRVKGIVAQLPTAVCWRPVTSFAMNLARNQEWGNRRSGQG